MPWKIGLRDYVIQAAGDLDFFKQAQALHFDGVEPGPVREQLQDPLGARLESLRRAKAETGLQIPSLSLNQHNQGGLGSTDSKTRDAAVEDIRRCFAWAEILDVRTFLIPFFGSGSLQDLESRRRVVQNLRVLCREAETRGIRLAYEGDLAAEDILDLGRQINSPAFACYFDLANPMIWGRDPLREFRLLKNLVVSVHIKDFNEKLGDCRPGEGRVPLEACSVLLRDSSYQGWLILETPPAPSNVVSRDRDFVKRMFGS